MNIDLEHLIYGLIAILLGIITRVTESKISAKKKKRRIGYSEASYILGGWALIFYGMLMLYLAFFSNN